MITEEELTIRLKMYESGIERGKREANEKAVRWLSDNQIRVYFAVQDGIGIVALLDELKKTIEED